MSNIDSYEDVREWFWVSKLLYVKTSVWKIVLWTRHANLSWQFEGTFKKWVKSWIFRDTKAADRCLPMSSKASSYHCKIAQNLYGTAFALKGNNYQEKKNTLMWKAEHPEYSVFFTFIPYFNAVRK